MKTDTGVHTRTTDQRDPPPPASNHPRSQRIEWPPDYSMQAGLVCWDEPEPRSFADSFCDAFTPPDALDDGINRSLFDFLPGPVQDALHIRMYYAIAIASYQRDLRSGGKHGR